MFLDVVDLRDFYSGELGRVVQPILAGHVRKIWPQVSGDRVLGIGFATPYIGQFSGEAERVIAFMPSTQGAVNWPTGGPNAVSLVVEDMLPLPDASVDRVVLVHALEMVNDPEGMLKEIWRVLSPGGRMLAIVPNRRGLWARVDTSPFGYGRPYSRRQLTNLLRQTMFSPNGWDEALYMMPVPRQRFLKSGARWEKVGARLWPAFAGVIMVEATKHLYQGIPNIRRLKVAEPIRPVLLPAPLPTPHREGINVPTAGTPPAWR
ncbi:class I SAM-dependent methyltransferase [Oryzibacter oryziterrae]|uniref:class I SAM-dependent methyltransferase n=1 Tax=Oryzibacter oryziterrae TaxID=2766474 RepID=UPI001F00F8B2|nr:class I SAM-dependent methyltransferase [Oryzibacter oryziterrae]